MSKVIAPTSLDTDLKRLLEEVDDCRMQLPEFQRSWTWDDSRICNILASLTMGYPMGAIMRLKYGNESVRFKYRALEGVKESNATPEYLILDGQQRLTSIYRATYSSDPVETTTEKGKEIKRYYYLDIKCCLDDSADRVDAIVSVPEDKKIKTDFDRKVVLDLSSPEKEYENEMFPLNIVFDLDSRDDWDDGYKEYYHYSAESKERYKKFKNDVLTSITGYKLPVITLDKSTPREAVCKVFENVNTGGVSLTVFELVTAMFATYEFNLREDWEKCRDIIRGKGENLVTDVMYGVDETAFLTSVTLYTTYLSDKATSCKKRDVLALSYEEYKNNRLAVCEGYKLARKFLSNQSVFRQRDLPYTTQLIPLSAICAVIGESEFNRPKTEKILSQWYWCGILGELYGGANETRYANDIEDVVASIRGKESPNRTVNAASFQSTRLLTLQTRLSAAYKGILGLLYKEGCRDFLKGGMMDSAKSMDENPDIHHIFPETYCRERFPREKWNSIVNKTPLYSATNRSIGGVAPSIYSKKIQKSAEIDQEELRQRIESNLIDYDKFVVDDFEGYFADRARKILKIIEKAMGKSVSDKGAEETIKKFGYSLE